MSIEVAPIHGSFARQVLGVSLSELIDGDPADKHNNGIRFGLCSVFEEHPVLVFRQQELNEDHLLGLGGLLGTPAEYVERSWHSSRPEISIVSNMRDETGKSIGGLSSRELNWHTDQSYNASPVTGCFLYAQVLPTDGSRTSWASLYGGYESLPEETKSRINNAIGTFSYAARTGAVITGEQDESVVQQSYRARIESTPDVKHPLVNTHPITGRRSFYIDPGTLTAIDGMSAEDSAELLTQLQQAATHANNVYHHDWSVGDLVLWDNAVTMHRRDAFADEQSRLLKRVIIDLPANSHIVPSLAN